MATVITTPVGLQNIKNDLTIDYELGNDINMFGVAFDPLGGWNGQDPFTGSFDGKGYKIRNLTIDKTGDDYVGLFGCTDDNAIIQDTILEDIDITGDGKIAGLVGLALGSTTIINVHITGTSSITALDNIIPSGGGLLGYVTNTQPEKITVDSCSSTATVTASNGPDAGGLIGLIFQANTYVEINDSYATGDVTGADYVGGLIGLITGAYSVVLNGCYATGDVTATGRYVGGLIGSMEAETSLSQCYATGNVVSQDVGFAVTGGLVGDSDGVITNCYAMGDVTGASDYVGGLVGLHGGTTTNCYSIGAVSGVGANVGGLIGDNDGTVTNSFWDMVTSGQALSDGGTGKTTAEMKTISTFQEAEWAISRIWNITSGCNSGYPCLIGVNACCSIPSSPSVDQTIVGKKVSLEAIRNIEVVYGGRFYIGKTGNAVYESRYHRNV